MEAILEAVKRTSRGKNEARRLRAAGRIPAVVYGAQKAGDAVAPSGGGRPEGAAAHPALGVRRQHPDHAEGRRRQRRARPGAGVPARPGHASPAARRLLPRGHGQGDLGHRADRPAGRSRRASSCRAACSTSCTAKSRSSACRRDIPEHIDVDVSDLACGQAHRVRDVAANATWTPVSEPDPCSCTSSPCQGGRATRRRRRGAPAAAAAEPEVAKKGKTDKDDKATKK